MKETIVIRRSIPFVYILLFAVGISGFAFRGALSTLEGRHQPLVRSSVVLPDGFLRVDINACLVSMPFRVRSSTLEWQYRKGEKDGTVTTFNHYGKAVLSVEGTMNELLRFNDYFFTEADGTARTVTLSDRDDDGAGDWVVRLLQVRMASPVFRFTAYDPATRKARTELTFQFTVAQALAPDSYWVYREQPCTE